MVVPAIIARDGTPLGNFAFGTMQFGDGSDEAESAACFEACREAGITAFDCAWVYTNGRAEEILGRISKADRESLILTTKGAYVGGASPANLEAQLADSLRRLGTDYVDIYFLHRFDDDTPLEDTFATLAAWQRDGRIRHIGVSNYAAWQVMKAQAVAAALGTRIDVIQPMYNLVKRQAEVELFPMCLAEGIATTPYSPLGGGLLTGKYVGDGAGGGRLSHDDRYATRYGTDWMHAAAQGLTALAADAGAHPATLAVAWAGAHPGVTAPLLSARTVAQLRPSLAAMTHMLDPDLKARLDALAPTPAPATDRTEEA
ncbi:MAG: aldo/keto reductase [Pseudomonadota bacterium]